ncbi:AAA family ATPase [Candidatus Nomurabacteria bacterium]|nr:AAA family ATPase [Candidatus Nomurabacteria bacterium]
MEKYKEKLLNSLKLHIDFIRGRIKENLERTKVLTNKSLRDISRMRPEDQMVQMQLVANAQNRVVELGNLDGSPYFMKFKIIDENKEEKEYFISKHQFSEESIYSWVAPIASIRFDSPGETSYRLPDGTIKKVLIKEKEQYMIVDGKVIFFAKEEGKKPRELIYQEHFTRQKSEFALPEIVAQIEKAQDQVIRASHRGPLVISGPAGSGKTTLALHRVAYLTQAPDTALYYPPRSIIVFVQDKGTKEYFSTLLPGLGINDVSIVTFSEWGFKVLGLNDYTYIERYGQSEEEKDLYEYQKLRAMREGVAPKWSSNIFRVLSGAYDPYLLDKNKKLFEQQKKEKKLDRFDLTLLLKSHFEKYGKFEIKREYKTFVRDNIVKRIERTPASYSLMIIDEFQNYLREQLNIFKSCQKEETKSVVFVGDIAQQVKLGTLRDFNELGEIIPVDRDIRLNKVYRNTKNILSFIGSLGYKVEIPEGVKTGPNVVEKITLDAEGEIKHIKEYIPKYEKGSIGIISKDESYLAPFRQEFDNMKNLHVLTMLESQGVEFDIVFIVGVNKDSFEVKHHIDVLPIHIEERKRMQKDLLYVALTRAITELHILGRDKFRTIL